MAERSDMNEMISTEEGDDPLWGIRVDNHLLCY